jgi:protein-S-isoprenylcysteine O-methyltransferase Ste14
MAKYTPPEQPKIMQWVDIIFVVAAIFLALWLPLQAGWAGVSRAIIKIDNPTWEALGQTPAQVEQWVKLGFADAAAAHDIIQNKFDYTINWVQLIIMAIVLIGYFVFLFRASDQEYKEVIDEKFNGKK